MGTVLQYCTGAEETQQKLDKAEKENKLLRQQLIKAKDEYRKLQQYRETKDKPKMKGLYEDKMNATEQLVREQQEKKRLADRYNKQNKRLSKTEDKAQRLEMENAKLREQLAASATITEEDEPEDSIITISEDRSTTGIAQEEEEKDLSPRTDMVKLRNWLVYKNLNEKDLKLELAKLLSSRSESHRSKIPEAYKQRYGADIMDDIMKIIKKGHVLELVDGLFKTRAQYDASCIREIVSSRKSSVAAVEIAEILACRNVNELQLISHEYKKMYGKEMKDAIYKLANGKTYQSIINNLFMFKRNDNDTTNKMKIAAKVKGDVEFLRDKNIKWKNYDNKRKMTNMILGNNKTYVHDLNGDFFKESGKNLTDHIDEVLGEKSTSGAWMKVRIEYCTDLTDFYARKIQIAGDDGWTNRTNATTINRILINNFGNGELKNIQKRFNELNYGNGKTMIEWTKKHLQRHEKYGFFLAKMLENSRKF